MVWFILADVFLLAGIVMIVRKKGLNVSFLISSILIGAWFFFACIGVYSPLGLFATSFLLCFALYITSAFLQALILRLFARKSDESFDKADRTKDEQELIYLFRRASEEDKRVINLILDKYELPYKKREKNQ
jgi:hypothetical protein